MTEVAAILQAYLRGETDWQGGLNRLRGVVESGLVTPQQALDEIDALCSQRVLPVDLGVALKQEIAAFGGAGPSVPDDSTRIKPIPGSSAPQEATGTRTGPPRERTAPSPTRAESPSDADASGTRTSRSAPISDWSRLAYEDSSSAETVAVGTVLNGRFTLEEVLGHGGMGMVFRARDGRKEEAGDHNPYVAVKVLGEEFKRHPQALIALQREAGKAQSLAHPNIVTVHDFDRDGRTVYMTMELLDGEPLDRTIAKSASHGGLPLRQVLPIVRGIGNALVYAHEKGIVHSDLKPSNVFVTKSGTVKVLDFGIARAIWSPDKAAKDTLFDARELGALTPAYASPEMLLELEPHPRDDIYALACISYELLAGKHPFDRMPAHLAMHAGLRPPAIPGVKRRQMRALQHGLAFTRGRRTANVEDFLRELSQRQRPAIGPVARRAVAVGVLISLGGAGYAAYYASQRCERIDQAFLTSLRENGGELPADQTSPEYQQRLAEYHAQLTSGQIYLDMGKKTFDPAILSEYGVSSAYGAFQEALKLNGSSAEAAEGVLGIVKLYSKEAARLLEAGNAARAAEIAAIGLRIHPRDCALNDTLRAAEQAQR
jgi:hypothetical protein